MKTEQLTWDAKAGWASLGTGDDRVNPQLVLYFGASSALASEHHIEQLTERYPQARILGCSSAGEILSGNVYDERIVATAIEFEATGIKVASIDVDASSASYQAGLDLAAPLLDRSLKGIFIISEGLQVNGSELVRGARAVVGDQIPLTGGLAGDGDQFELTRVGCDTAPRSGMVAAVGFYGDAITIGHGSVGGWQAFGPLRRITKSERNVLYELDHKPALELYKKYLAEESANLPGSALLFPLMVWPDDNDGVGIVRTVLAVDESQQSMTFAGDVPNGYTAQLMRANFDKLIDGAGSAARIAEVPGEGAEKLAVLVSCVGRKMILGQRTADEVEAVQSVLGADIPQIGFYSYGEISPHVTTGTCELHNQTMTVTVFSESERTRA